MKKRNLFFKVAILISSISLLSGCSVNSFTNNVEVNTYNLSENVKSVQNFSTESNDSSEEENTDLVVYMLSYSKSNVTQSIQFRVETSDDAPDANYYVGYYEKETKYPAYLEYNVSDKKGNIKTMKTEIVKKANHGLGSSLGASVFTSYCDIEVPYDYSVDTDSIKLTNVYKALFKYDADGYVTSRDPDLDNPCTFKLEKYRTYAEYDLSKILDNTFVKFSEYNDYLGLTIKFHNYGLEEYTNLSSTASDLYKKNIKNIESGVIKVRTRLSIGGDTILRVTKKDNSFLDVKTIAGDLKFYDKDNYGTFLIENLSKEDVKNFQIYGASVSVELFNTSTSKIVPRSTITTRFGLIDTKMVDILNSDNSIAIDAVEISSSVNYSLRFIIISIIFVIVYAGAAIGYYFFLKNRDKKSEFKILNNRNFIKNGILGFVFLGSLLLDILYINARSTYFNNSLTVYNPLDWVIMLTSVIVICLGGYFIKYYWTAYKDHKEKVARERLNLNADKDEDGTN